MMDTLYYCTPTDNICSKKESCKRYMQADGNVHTTLFKNACNENNKHILFIKYKECKEGVGECQS